MRAAAAAACDVTREVTAVRGKSSVGDGLGSPFLPPSITATSFTSWPSDSSTSMPAWLPNRAATTSS
eukprot:7379438-Prymnesium_polylepis.1